MRLRILLLVMLCLTQTGCGVGSHTSYSHSNCFYVDKHGRNVYEVERYCSQHDFSDGLALVELVPVQTNLTAATYLDKNFKPVIRHRYKSGEMEWTCGFAGPFSEGRAALMVKNKWGYIDKTGKFVIRPQFNGARMFHEGIAMVVVNGKAGYIDKRGHYIVRPRLEPLASPMKMPKGFSDRPSDYGSTDDFSQPCDFCDGLAIVRLAGKFGYIDKSGRFICRPRFERAEYLSDGMAAVRLNGKWGYIDRTGHLAIKPKFDGAEVFQEGLAVVRSGAKSMFIDKRGSPAIPTQYESAHAFSHGLAPIRIKGKWGYIDKTGKVIIPPQFDDARPFEGDVAVICVRKSCGLVNRAGKTKIIPGASGICSFRDGFAQVEMRRHWMGLIDTRGRFVIPPRYRFVGEFHDDYAMVIP